jgi:ankyrin repeat protein
MRDWQTTNEQDIVGRIPLHIACQRGWAEGVKALLGLRPNTAIKTIYSSTPLHYAAVRGSVEICRDLLQHGSCQPFAVGYEGRTAGYYALMEAHTYVSTLLAHYESSRAGQTLPTSQDLENSYGSLSYESAHNAGADHNSRDGIRLEDPAEHMFNLVVDSYPQSPVPGPVFSSHRVPVTRPSFLENISPSSHSIDTTRGSRNNPVRSSSITDDELAESLG